MTPEQEEQWKAAVMPVALGVMDGYEVAEEGLAVAEKRLTTHHVPVWAIFLRQWCVHYLEIDHDPRLPAFLIGCEVALVAISLRHVSPEDNRRTYNNILLTFLREAVSPLLEHIENTDDSQRRRDYEPLFEVYQLYMERHVPLNIPLQDSFDEVPDELFELRATQGNNEVNDIKTLALTCSSLAGSVLFGSDTGYYAMLALNLVEDLMQLHKWQSEGGVTSGRRYSHLIATAFLTALEAECPPPDWLPRI